jgi:uncharacterized protein (TIGR03382 family)
MNAALVLIAAAHAAEPAPKIVNGQEEEGFPSVYSLGAEFGANRLSLCTGNLITPRVILTAAHCSEDVPIELLVTAGKAFGGPVVNEATEILTFSDAAIHPDYVPLQNGPGGTLGENDIAVIILAEPATTRPVLLRQSPVTDADLGKELLSVGFGITETGRGDGVKRSAALLLSDYDEFFLLSENESNENNANICSGDSGGPQFSWVEDHWEQWAVHSWGDQNCRQISGSTRVDVVQQWILDQIEAVHGTRDQCEASGWYGDGACDPWCPAEDVDCLPPEDPEEDAVDGEGDSKGSGGCAAAPSPTHLGWALLPLALLLRGRRRS